MKISLSDNGKAFIFKLNKLNMNKICTALCTLAFIFAIQATAQTKKVKDELDGKVYNIDLLKDSKKAKPIADEISFKGKFKSKFATEENFPGAVYDLEVDSTVTPKVMTFSVELKVDKEKFVWEGKVIGENIEGTAYIMKKEKTTESYTFTGTEKVKKKPAGK